MERIRFNRYKLHRSEDVACDLRRIELAHSIVSKAKFTKVEFRQDCTGGALGDLFPQNLVAAVCSVRISNCKTYGMMLPLTNEAYEDERMKNFVEIRIKEDLKNYVLDVLTFNPNTIGPLKKLP